MGIIQRQALKSTFFSFAGTIFGFVSIFIIMPHYLSTTQLGLLSFVNSTTKLIATVFTLGVPLITLNLFLKYKNKNNQHNGFLTFIFFMSLIGIVLGILFFLTLNDSLINGEQNTAKYYTFFTSGWIFLFIFRLLFLNFDTYLRMNLKTVLGVFLESFLNKIIFLFGLLAYIFGIIDFDGIFWMNILAMSFPGIVIILYLISKRESFFNFKFIKRYTVRAKQLGTIATYGIIGGIGSSFVMEIDKFMISNQLGLSSNGVYSVMVLFGLFIILPSTNLKRISTPILSKSWKENDLDNIDLIYKKSATNQLLMGFYIFIGIWYCIDYVMAIFELDWIYRISKDVIFYIGISQLIDMSMGVNGEIILTSKHYRYNTYLIGALIVVAFLTNWILIPIFGLDGAAIATILSVLIINVVRYLFLKIKYQFSPFSKEFFITLSMGLLIYFLAMFIPKIENNFIGILMNGGLITLFFWTLAYLFKVSPELNKMINKYSRLLFK